MHELAEQTHTQEKGPRTTLEVRVGASLLRELVAADAFCKALDAMGLDRVAAIGLTVCGLPLLSKGGPPIKNGTTRGNRKMREWFIVTHSSTREKKAILEQAADALKIPIEVRVLTMNDALRATLLD